MPGAGGTVREPVAVCLLFGAEIKYRTLVQLFEGEGCAHRLHYLEVSDEGCKARLRQRNEDGKHEFAVSEELFDLFTSHFAPPSDQERFDVILHRH
ncbi:MAG: AAA family ATPase [Devosia sp.]